MKQSNEHSIKEVIDKLLNQYHLKEKLNETQLISAWERIMGPTIAKRTDKIYVKDKKLFVFLNSSVLKQELNMAREKILTLIADEFGKNFVLEVVIR